MRAGRGAAWWAAGLALVVAAACSSSKALPKEATSSPAVLAGVPPTLQDHWHAAIGVNICGQWEPGPIWEHYTADGLIARAGTNTYAGLHTHTLQNGQSDGLIHVEPRTSDETGTHATVARWLEYGGWEITPSALSLWRGAHGRPIEVRAGMLCPAGTPYAELPITITWATAFRPGDPLVEQHTAIINHRVHDHEVIAVYAIPRTAPLTGELQRVPSAANLGP